jgi:hypothetical protein
MLLSLCLRLCYVVKWTPLWSNGQSSWLQIQIFWKVVGLERGPLSLLRKIEELLERKSRSSGLENQEYGYRDPLCWPPSIRTSWH